MSFNHSVSDLVAIIRNGYCANKHSVSSPVSNLRESILKILKDEGYILNYLKVREKSHDIFSIVLKYHNLQPALKEISVVSKPGKKVYCRADSIPLIRNGLGMILLSTSRGILPDYTARTEGLGGEILLKIF